LRVWFEGMEMLVGCADVVFYLAREEKKTKIEIEMP
jgi:hypothetical protein